MYLQSFVASSISVGIGGNPVHEVMSDYKRAEEKRSGYLRVLLFNLDQKLLRVSTYSPNLGKIATSTQIVPEPTRHAFELPLQL